MDIIYNFKKVQVVLINILKNEVLTLQVNPQRGSFWQNITGSVENNESFTYAAERELFEETSIKPLEITELDLKFEFTDQFKRNVIEKVFYATCNINKVIFSNEHQNYKWLSINNFPQNLYKYESNMIATMKALDAIK